MEKRTKWLLVEATSFPERVPLHTTSLTHKENTTWIYALRGLNWRCCCFCTSLAIWDIQPTPLCAFSLLGQLVAAGGRLELLKSSASGNEPKVRSRRLHQPLSFWRGGFLLSHCVRQWWFRSWNSPAHCRSISAAAAADENGHRECVLFDKHRELALEADMRGNPAITGKQKSMGEEISFWGG